jgi:type I restriction enzyme, R subunit
LSDSRGNAMLVAGSIYEACRYFEIFQQTEFRGRCAVVTSYNPNTRDIVHEETGANTETERQFIFKTYEKLLVKKPDGGYETILTTSRCCR